MIANFKQLFLCKILVILLCILLPVQGQWLLASDGTATGVSQDEELSKDVKELIERLEKMRKEIADDKSKDSAIKKLIKGLKGAIKEKIKDEIKKKLQEDLNPKTIILGPEVHPVMDQIFKAAKKAIDREGSASNPTGRTARFGMRCKYEIFKLAKPIADDLANRSMMRAFGEIPFDVVKTIFDIVSGEGIANWIKDKIKDKFKEILKKWYQELFQEALKESTKPVTFETDFDKSECKPKVNAFWFPATGTYQLIIKGDCHCERQAGRYRIGKWEVQAVGRVAASIDSTGGTVTFKYKVRPAKIIIFANDNRPNCGCKTRRTIIKAYLKKSTFKLKPGEGATFQIEAKNHATGANVQILSATSTGLVAVTGEKNEPKAMGLPGNWAGFGFTVAKPRWDRQYEVGFNLKTAEGPSFCRGFVIVKNVAPKITKVELRAKAEPDKIMELKDAEITVKDDNADDKNPNELVRNYLDPGNHPWDLDTERKDKRFSNGPEIVDKDFNTGTYVFRFSFNKKKVIKPHMHGEFITKIKARDNNGLWSDPVDIIFEVLDVAPKVISPKAVPQFVHAGDKREVFIKARFSDDNGWQDIDKEKSFIDATPAGGKKYFINKQDMKIKVKDERIDVETKKFRHTINEKKKVIIPLLVQDKKDAKEHPHGGNQGKGETFIKAGNERPVIGPWGYIYGVELGPQRDQKGKGLCPGQMFTVGAGVKDPENDEVEVWAIIKETKQKVELKQSPGEKTYKGTMTAPRIPGKYTIKFYAKEKPPRSEKAVVKKSPLRVIKCETGYIGIPGERPKKKLGVVGVLLGLAALAVAGYFIYTKIIKKDEEEKKEYVYRSSCFSTKWHAHTTGTYTPPQGTITYTPETWAPTPSENNNWQDEQTFNIVPSGWGSLSNVKTTMELKINGGDNISRRDIVWVNGKQVLDVTNVFTQNCDSSAQEKTYALSGTLNGLGPHTLKHKIELTGARQKITSIKKTLKITFDTK